MEIPNVTVIKDDEPRRVWDLIVPIVRDEKTNTTKAYLTGSIDEPSTYNELCYLLQESSAKEKIHLYINTPGGVVDSAFMVANAIRASKANVIGHLSGTVASAGTLISMACNELAVEDHVAFMVHNYSGTMGGKGNEMKARQTFMDKSITSAFNDYYSGFLTKKEIIEVVEGKDLWMDTEEIIKRWESKVSYVKGKV